MSAHHQQFIPRGVLIGAGLLIATTITFVGVVQYQKRNDPAVENELFANATQVHERFIKFPVNADGKLSLVVDANTGEVIDELVISDGFIRTVLMSMSFDRRRDGVEEDPIYRLVRWDDSRVSLEDPTTGVIINLGAFGYQNKSVFERFLPPFEAAQ